MYHVAQRPIPERCLTVKTGRKYRKIGWQGCIHHGAGAGIAKTTALVFAREGAKVAIIEINGESGRSVEHQVLDAGGEAIFVETNVTHDDQVKRAIDATIAKYRHLNVLMNCAGGSLQEDVPVHETGLNVWRRTIDLNLLHPFLSCRHGIPHMIRAGSGSIINFSSHLGLIGSQKPAYAAAKGGIVSFESRMLTGTTLAVDGGGSPYLKMYVQKQ